MLKAEILSLIFIGYIIGLGFLSNYFFHRIDTKVLYKSHEQEYRESFIAERAYQHLRKLNDFGPKVIGSKANEILAANYLRDEILEIQKNASRPDDIALDRQLATGSRRNSNNYYFNIQNIVVRLQGETNHALMLNCHFDSVPGSPGASDNSVNCCIMLEILRILSKSPNRQKHTIIFLFNGAEENGLQAAHGFMTQQKWREEIRAYINLESTGSGGKELLFRTGPRHDWLVRMYRESVPRPYGQGVSEELFETGVIPSATDFEIFRDYGNIPGLDFAYIKDGWRYHTRYDSIEYIPMESVQHSGNNILQLTRKIANSDELADPPEGTYSVFFDFLGLIFISYTKALGAILNYIIAVFAFLIPFILQTKFKIANVGYVFGETIIGLITMTLSVILAGVLVWAMALMMNAFDNTMSWYNSTFLIIGIYCSIAVFAQILTYHVSQLLCGLFFNCIKTYKEASLRDRVDISLNGVTLFWSILTIAVTIKGYRLGYIFMILLLFSLCTYLLAYLVARLISKAATQIWMILHIFGHSVIFISNCYMMFLLVHLFIPIVGRTFYENPETVIGGLCILWMIFTMSYFIPLSQFIKFRAILYVCLGITVFVCTILAFTPIGFPYSNSRDAPRTQRFSTAHIKRTIYDYNGNMNTSLNNVVVYGWDRNSMRTIKKTFSEYDMMLARDDRLCPHLLQCGFLRYGLNDRAIVLNRVNEAPNIQPTKFKLIRSERVGSSVFIEFSLELRTAVNFYLRIAEGLSIVASNFVTRGNFRTNRFVTSLTVGAKPEEPHIMEIELTGNTTSETLALLTFVTEDSTFDQGEITAEYRTILNKYPDYTFSYVYQADSTTYEIKKI